MRLILPAIMLLLAVPAWAHMPVDLEGELEIMHEDRADGAHFAYTLDVHGKRYKLEFKKGDEPTDLTTGSRLRVHGAMQGGTVTVTARGSNKPAPTPSPIKLGARRVLFVLMNFADTTPPYTVESARQLVFGTTDAFFRENSFQQAWLAGDLIGWFPLTDLSGTCDTASIEAQARLAALAAGYDPANYQHLAFGIPSTSCGWGGLSTIVGEPSRAWYNGPLSLDLVAHELGHGLGLWHAHSLDCGADILGTVMSQSYPPPPGTCWQFEYGHIADVMANRGHMSAFAKERIGWLNYGAAPPITTVTVSGTYTITAYESGPGSKALKILKYQEPTGAYKDYYYVEARKAVGFDSFLSTAITPFSGLPSTVQDGVLVGYSRDINHNWNNLLDMNPNPEPDPGPGVHQYDWLNTAALRVGQTFSDPASGVSITLLGVTAQDATVSVVVPTQPCVRRNGRPC